MPIPEYQTTMLPLLEFLSDGKEHSLREAIDSLATVLKLTEEDLKKLLPSGQQAVFDNRVGWAKAYLKKACLLESTRFGHFRITQRGKEVLSEKPTRIDSRFLERFDEFREFRALRHTRPNHTETVENQVDNDTTPEEALESAYERLKGSLASDLLQQIKNASPSLFEKLVVELLVKMGYGGSRQDAGQAIGKSGDEGIDGIIKEDRLGLDIIYIQAKRWENTVSRPEVQKFAGALQGQRAKKGIMITTAAFSKEAREYVTRIDNKIVLIDGEQLTNFMIDHNLGVSPVSIYEIKKVDSDYFME